MPPETISLDDARRLVIAAQSLAQLPSHPAGKDDLLSAIRRMGYLQIDTISVVARSPYLVLWSRLGDYPPAWLDELLAEGALFEYWSHAMCFLPIEDFPLYRRAMLDTSAWIRVREWIAQHPDLAQMILERIRLEGGLRSADFVNGNKPAGGWWNWKDEKTALECLFILGELMVARRQSFQRVYDLPARVLPTWDDGPDAANVPSREHIQRTLTLRSVQALGVAHTNWVPDVFRLSKTGNAQRLESLADEGLLRRVQIEGLPGAAYLDPAADLPAPAGSLTTVLSPFDPLVADRKRLKALFGFDYMIEVYTPAHKRSFGYFTLPILHGEALVGRLDPKAHRSQGVFEVRALGLEPGVEPSEELVAGLADALRRLAAWHGTPELVIRRTEPEGLAERLFG
jgi:uncharacterized protein